MKRTEFISELKKSLGIDDNQLTEETNLKEIENYDSITVMMLVAFIDEKFGLKFNAAQLASLTSIKSLIELIGIEKFEI